MEISPPKSFGHSLRTTLIENQCYIAIIIDRKSRLIMKDKRFILELSKKIQTNVLQNQSCFYKKSVILGSSLNT